MPLTPVQLAAYLRARADLYPADCAIANARLNVRCAVVDYRGALVAVAAAMFKRHPHVMPARMAWLNCYRDTRFNAGLD